MIVDKKTQQTSRDLNPETIAAQALGRISKTYGDIIPPIHVTSTYERDGDNQYSKNQVYARPDNPTTRQCEDLITALEKRAVDTALFASGMAACVAVFQQLKHGAHVIAPKIMYWALRNWLIENHETGRISVSFVDTNNVENVASHIKPNQTQLIWVETPANPMWDICDIEAIASLAHSQNLLLAVDSTVATPLLSSPLDLGADLVMHSATKYLNGHSDVLAGSLSTANNNEFWQSILKGRQQTGPILGPFEAAMLMRGIRTLPLRVKAACQNAAAIADRFSDHPQISEVLYPGLASHSGHKIAKKQMRGGFGGMLSLRIKGGEAQAVAVASKVKIWKRATSLGGVESLIEHRASIEGKGTPVPSDLLRLSCGIENAEDLIADLEQALS